MSSHLEVEIKLPVTDPEKMAEQICSAGAQAATARVFEDNFVLDLADGRMRAARVMLRLRLTDGEGLLTVKTEVTDQGDYKVRQETETRVSDGAGLLATLQAAGFATIYRYQKYRRLYRCANLLITLDELPLGNYMELEGEASDIDRFAGRLGFGRRDYINETYRTLHEQKHSAAGLAGEPLELVFPGGAGT
jgi:adenylate cyclase class 2